ncbi:MAG TPA: alpha-hydroxy-acid oxidizing protein [Firmicutes bacterium]|nr:alpha-hydroxy-acid oxidizing protein [Bacillota bacterium]
MEWKEIRQRARERLQGYCRVCPQCDGRACAGEVPGFGGVGTGSSFRANYESLAQWKVNMRTIHGARDGDPTLKLFGYDLSTPILGAPIAGAQANLGGAMSDAELTAVLLEGCRLAGTIGMAGHVGEIALEEIKRQAGRGIMIHKPLEQAKIIAWGRKMAEVGAAAFGIDIDGAGLINMRLAGIYVEPKTPAQLAELVQNIPLPFIVKGIMTPAEAELAVQAGAAAIVVSNHGGRVLDHTPGVAQVLPAIARRVKGKITILTDGAVRTGVDVLKMLALGADAVLVGRPLIVAAVGGGAAGVKCLLERMTGELVQAMILTGCKTLADIGPHLLYQEEL